MAYKVFISAADKDIDLARDLAHRLEEAGVKVSKPVRIARVGETVATAINRYLRGANEVVVLLTRSSIDDQLVLFEMGAALGLYKRVTPVVVGLEAQSLPPFVRRMPYVRYADLHSYIAGLKRRATN
jgi:hypothetical protein